MLAHNQSSAALWCECAAVQFEVRKDLNVVPESGLEIFSPAVVGKVLSCTSLIHGAFLYS